MFFIFLSWLFFSGISLYATPVDISPPSQQKPELPPCKRRVFIAADFIYWIARQEGNDYALTGSAITVPGTTDPNTSSSAGILPGAGALYAPHPRLMPGFKGTLGVRLPDQWELFSQYSYLSSRAKGVISSNNLNTGILPIFSYTPHNSILASTLSVAASGATGFVEKADAHWILLFNNVSFELERKLCFSPRFFLNPHFGLQGSWQKQHFKARYTVNSIAHIASVLGENDVFFDQHFWGIGPRAGLKTSWQCAKPFSLFANPSASMLWGRFKTHARSLDTNSSAGYSGLPIADQLQHFSTLSPVLQLELGFQFDWLLRHLNPCSAFFAWETQVWFFQNQHSSTIANTSLILQGLTASVRADF